MSSIALECKEVTKSFDRRFVVGGYTTFKTQLVQLFSRGAYREQLQRQKIEVLRGVDFKIERGETVGIIGQNGAGKSTLLKLMTGIYKPTSGTITRNGRISALLELGAGFHPEFSGRENIYMSGMILGLTRKQLRAKEEEIIAFSELGAFIDAPVRTYSSGMYMRLAFSVAVNVNPDILIIDEVLAVGDEHFQHKSKAKIDEFKTKDAAIILVTHDLAAVQTWCTRAIWLEQGRVAADGFPADVVANYRAAVAERENEARRGEQTSAELTVNKEQAKRWGDKRMTIERVRMKDASGTERLVFRAGEPVFVEVDVNSTLDTDRTIGIALRSTQGEVLFGTNTKIENVVAPKVAGPSKVVIGFDSINTVGMGLALDVALESPDSRPHDYWTEAVKFDVVRMGSQIGAIHSHISWNFGS